MKVGDVVVPSYQCVIDGKFFHCGSGRYTHAIVGSLDPFILVSSGGTMVWSCTWTRDEVTPLCQASADILAVVAARIEKERLKPENFTTEKRIELFNKEYPVGTPCRYYPVKDEEEYTSTKIRHGAWALGSGHLVCKVEGKAGGISIEHIRHDDESHRFKL